ncbi:uncharacterized protein LOC112028026 isoform X5 [Quercus suber]|uniref:uncharacterized protein LOC112028026 isoform X5 n=1 Tax=Quercus suber TaxID=58331 RepID=UPI0032DEFEFB
MDYDDNDFQSQNLHLAGEGSTKFPPVLQPYALPKFDFDDSLQGHLRFDSLVETEVFLGIESNEDNQWIEDFSRGSSGIEFNSSAAESCSISRRNNVWSEATSSESVEMLLKSVGQEETILRQTIVEESDACDELGSLTKQMEPSLKHDDDILPKIGDDTDLKSTLPQDEIPENFSMLKEDIPVEPCVEDTSKTHEGEFSVDGRSGELDPNAVSVKGGLPMIEEDPFADSKSDVADRRDINPLVDEYVDHKTQEDFSASGMQVDNMVPCAQNIISSGGEQNNEDLQHEIDDVGNMNLDGLQTRNDERKEEFHVLSREAENLDGNAVESGTFHLENPLGSTSKVDSVEEGNDIENRIINAEEPSSMVVVSALHTAEQCTEDVDSRIPVETRKCDAVLFKDTEFGEPSKVNTHEVSPLAFEGDTNFEGYAVQVSGPEAGISASVEPKMDAIVQLTYGLESVVEKDNLLESSQQLDNEILVSKSEASLSSKEDNKVSKVEDKENSSSHVGGISTVTVCSSAELLREACETGTLKVGQVVFEVSRENLVAEDHVSSSILDESTQICEADKVYGQGDVHKCDIDVSISDKKSTKLPSESSNMDCVVDGSLIVDKGAGTSSQCEGSAGNEPVVPLDVTVSNESALNATLENAKVASFDMTGVLQPSENVKTIDGVGDCKEVLTVSSVGTFTYSDKESTATKISTEAILSTLKESSELETEPGPASESEKDASFDTAGKLLQKTVHQSLPKADTCNAEIQREVQTVVVNEVNQECIRGTEVHAAICEVAAKEGGAADAVTFLEKREEATVEENLEKASSEASGSLSSAICAMESGSASSNPDKPTGSPNIISTTELSQSEKEKEGLRASTEEEVNRSTDQKAQVAEIDDVETSNSLSVSGDPKGKDSSKDEQSFSFEIGSLADLSRKDTGKNSQPFPSISAVKVLPIVEGSPSTSGLGQMDAKISQDNSTGSPQVSEGQITRGGSKGTHERKTRRTSGKTAIGKETPKRGNHVKGTTPTKQSERGDKAATASLSPSAIFQFVQSREMQHYGHVEGNSTKPIFVIAASASSLPDLNTSASPSTLFQQPFTDLQQVQLRAQIFVYGALIQGTAPEEAHMISAFGGPDGGRNVWENAWRACMERLHSQKSLPITPETPLPSRSEFTSTGARVPDQASKQSTLQSKGVSSLLGRTSSKGTPTVVNSMIPLSSPLWSMPTPSGDALQSSVMQRGSAMDYQQTLSPLHPFQTPPVRNFVGHNTPWISQGPFRGPWMASPQTSAPDASTRLPNTEAIKLTPVKELSVPHSSGIKHPVVHSGVPTSTSLLDPKKVTASPGKNSTDPKSRKRRKNPVSEDLGQIVLQSQSQPEPVSTPAVTSHLPTSVVFTMPTGFASKATSEKFVISESPISSMDHLQKKADQDVQQRASLSEETLSKVKEARLQAEDAAVLSAAAVSHSQEVWSQLEERKNSGLVSDVEAKLASAAVAVAAAAAVSKAAAAAAKVASNAALQAKLMAEEALVLNGYGNPSQSTGPSLPDCMNILGQATPASILKGDNRTNSSSSIIIAAKEAVRKRVEAASAATKRAENMDAIVKAAELAAEAISQAGKIVAMGDPLPLTELLEFGPEGYWKVSRESTELVGKSIEVNREQLSNDIVGEGPDTSTKHQKDGASVKETKSATHEKSQLQTEMPKESMVDHMRLVDAISVPIPSNETDSRVQKGRKVSDLAKTIGVVPESEIGSRSTVRNEYEKAAETFKEDSIKEGSHVEVLKDTEGFKAAWFTANVLSLEDGKAYVCYTELQTDNAEGQLKEWVSLQGEGDKVPKIRTARPVTIMRYEGTRKRRRAAMGDFNWSVGDRVDAWIRDRCVWCEGIITEKNKKDETELTVHFPAQGETSVVRAWHLRPSLIWKDGEWIEWSNLRENVSASHEGDMPQEKRIKLGSPAAEAKGKDKMLESKGVVELGKSEESRLLDLSENEKLFNVGKNTRNENKPDALRTLRTGLQKEGSRVVIGVPKPGKKRKFMEVSKHYVADRGNKINEPNDSVKFVKYLMPQGSGSRGWKNSTKSSILKEKRVAETKPRGLKTGKPQSVSGRTVPAKDSLSINAVSAPDDGTLTNHSAKVKDSISHAENASGKHNQFDIGSLSSTLGTAEGPILFSSRASSSDGSSKKVSTSNAKSERANKGKLAPAGGKLAKIEEDKIFNGNSAKSTSEVVEPRRSNRRIQPTSRLLEGLQSSLIISKIPSVSHDKGHKSSNRSASRGNNHG